MTNNCGHAFQRAINLFSGDLKNKSNWWIDKNSGVLRWS